MISKVAGNIVDVVNRRIFPGEVSVANGKIEEIVQNDSGYQTYIVPGFVDAHIHIESSMLPPAEFARIAAVHGTVATVSDPHEIANVLGVDGVRYMIQDARQAPVKIFFGAPSCVPATPFETSGASLGPQQVDELLRLDEAKFLAEVMNVPGILHRDASLMKMIESARTYGKVVDGHAPGLTGKDLETYIRAGISTDHECLSYEEAVEKINLGMKILIREGSAARDFEKLIFLAADHYQMCMFCSDDKHPDDLVEGHINQLVQRAVQRGVDVMKALTIASVNPVLHYGLDVGLLRRGDWADFLEVDNLSSFNVLKTFHDGEVVAERGQSLRARKPSSRMNNFSVRKKEVNDFALQARGRAVHVIEALDGQLITNHRVEAARVLNGMAVSDLQRDILKIVAVSRYKDARPAVGFIKNVGIGRGAIASSVAHDSHNIIAVGVTDEDICIAVNTVIEHEGGICAVSGDAVKILPLPVAGIMSDEDYVSVASKYTELDAMAKAMGSSLRAPFMTLSFMALPVIPSLKLSDQGLFDGETFQFVDVFVS